MRLFPWLSERSGRWPVTAGVTPRPGSQGPAGGSQSMILYLGEGHGALRRPCQTAQRGEVCAVAQVVARFTTRVFVDVGWILSLRRPRQRACPQQKASVAHIFFKLRALMGGFGAGERSRNARAQRASTGFVVLGVRAPMPRVRAPSACLACVAVLAFLQL